MDNSRMGDALINPVLIILKLSNSYTRLGSAFYKRALPAPVAKPVLLLWNNTLATDLNIDESLSNDPGLIAQYFSGNQLPEGADTIALAYCGHQFGQLNPQLGDGRAHLIGEIVASDNTRVDIQLKGSGPTPFSRQGDGRCALGPALREYIMSEAMHYLGVPTSRCLAVVATGEPVYRESVKPGAVVTRVAASHIRVGTFQYFAIRNDLAALRTLLDYSLERHFPEINASAGDKALQFFAAVMAKQITLIVHWMRVGFIHGVMNTDNTAICGETIDFGPCAMMGAWHPETVYSSIDKQGRYAFGNQPSIALWNMARLAESLLPLIDADEKKAVTAVEALLTQFMQRFKTAYFSMLCNKSGLSVACADNTVLVNQLLDIMQHQALDYTKTFAALTRSFDDNNDADQLQNVLGSWYQTWRQRVEKMEGGIEVAKNLMKHNNPVVIPRNHHIEAILKTCEEEGSARAAEAFLSVLHSPYEQLPATAQFQDVPVDGDKDYRTFCGT